MTEANAFETVREIATGHWLSRCLHVVASLGVAGGWTTRPGPPAELAQAVGSPDSEKSLRPLRCPTCTRRQTAFRPG